MSIGTPASLGAKRLAIAGRRFAAQLIRRERAHAGRGPLQAALALGFAFGLTVSTRGVEPPPAPDDDRIVLGRITWAFPSFGSLRSDAELDEALEKTPAREQARERMAAVLAGEISLFQAQKLSGQARLDYLESAARSGDAGAAAAIGEMLTVGDGVAPDAEQAFGYLLAAALGGHKYAAHNVAAAYAKGEGVRRDFTESLAWFVVARKRGSISKNEERLREHLAARGRAGVIEAADARARLLERKAPAAEVVAALPPPKPIRFDDQRAIQLGDVSNAVPQDAESDQPDQPPVVVITILGERRQWPSLAALERAAARGEATAMSGLGRLLNNGKLLPRDPLAALAWLERAATQSDVDAAHQLGDMYSKGDGVLVDGAKAFTYYTQAARGGSVLAMANVGACYVNAKGTERDYVRGLAWLLVAKRRGADLGQEAQLRRFLAQHRPDDLVKADALAAELERELPRRT